VNGKGDVLTKSMNYMGFYLIQTMGAKLGWIFVTPQLLSHFCLSVSPNCISATALTTHRSA
jgi:hypothetical protein